MGDCLCRRVNTVRFVRSVSTDKNFMSFTKVSSNEHATNLRFVSTELSHRIRSCSNSMRQVCSEFISDQRKTGDIKQFSVINFRNLVFDQSSKKMFDHVDKITLMRCFCSNSILNSLNEQISPCRRACNNT